MTKSGSSPIRKMKVCDRLYSSSSSKHTQTIYIPRHEVTNGHVGKLDTFTEKMNEIDRLFPTISMAVTGNNTEAAVAVEAVLGDTNVTLADNVPWSPKPTNRRRLTYIIIIFANAKSSSTLVPLTQQLVSCSTNPVLYLYSPPFLS
jgi:hypothetical protein